MGKGLDYYNWSFKPCPRCGNELIPSKQKIDRNEQFYGNYNHYIICKNCGFHSTKTINYKK